MTRENAVRLQKAALIVALVGSACLWLIDLTNNGEWRGLFFGAGVSLVLAVTVSFWTIVVLGLKLRSRDWPSR